MRDKTAYRPIRTQSKAYDASAEIDTAIGQGVKVVRLLATTLCHVNFGPTGASATTANMPLQANVPEYFNIEGGEFIQAIKNTTAGTLYVTEMG